MSGRKRYLLNFAGPNFLASLGTLFRQLQRKGINTVDFKYRAHVGFGSGLLSLEAGADAESDILALAKKLDWNKSFISSNLPDFYDAQRKDEPEPVHFFVLDDQWDDVLRVLARRVGGKLETEAPDVRRIDLPEGLSWRFTCAKTLPEASEKLTDDHAERCNVLLLDINLNRGDAANVGGVRFFDRLRDSDRLLPTIMITQGIPALTGQQPLEWGDDIVQMCWEAGAWFFLYKSELPARLEHIVDLLVERRTDPLVITVTSSDLSRDLSTLFNFLRNETIKVVGVDGASDFQDARQSEPARRRLVIDCAKHESISANDLAERYYAHLGYGAMTADGQRVREQFRFHHGKIYEVMQLG